MSVLFYEGLKVLLLLSKLKEIASAERYRSLVWPQLREFVGVEAKDLQEKLCIVVFRCVLEINLL